MLVFAELSSYGELFLLVLLFNIMPAFAPPTWLVLSYFKLKNPEMDTLLILISGLLGATLGRFIMYKYSSFFARYLPKKNREALEFVEKLSKKEGKKVFIGSFLYSLSPLSSNIMFIFAGASNIKEIPLFAGFFLGRLISYGAALLIYVGTINSIERSLNIDVKNLTDIVSFIIAISLMFIDWKGVYGKLRNIIKVSKEGNFR